MRTVRIPVEYQISAECQHVATLVAEFDKKIPLKQTLELDVPLDVALAHGWCSISDQGTVCYSTQTLVGPSYWRIERTEKNGVVAPVVGDERYIGNNHRAVFDHFLTPQEGLELLLTAKQRYAAYQEALKQSPEWEEAQRKCDEENATRARVAAEKKAQREHAMELLNKFLADPVGCGLRCVKHAYGAFVVSQTGVPDSEITVPDLQVQIREQVEAAIKQWEAEYVTGVAAAWVDKHGSERLRLAEELGLLDKSLAVYRDERLQHEMPNWRWLANLDIDNETEILNPSERVLSAYAAAREKYGDKVELSKWRTTRTVENEDGEVEEKDTWIPVLTFYVVWAEKWAAYTLK